MITISLCMIVKNEEDVLERCLNSAKELVDEIIIVDTGSTDGTKDIAKKFTDKIYDFKWINDFSAARNFAFDKATMDYTFWMDADDVILPEDQIKFNKLRNELPSDIDVVMMYYNIAFDDKGRVTFSYYRERLLRRSLNLKWHEPVHEYLKLSGKIVKSDVCITHAKIKEEKTSRNLEIYKALLDRGEKLSPRGTYYYARELKDNKKYEEAIRYFIEFLDSNRGWVEDNISACAELAKCYQALEDSKNALGAMFRSFSYDTPRGEICCQIGYHFKNNNQFRQAVYWFETALSLEKPIDSWGFYQKDYWGYIPCLECVVCYDKLGNHIKAEEYNDKAAIYKPDSPAVAHNKKYFESKRQLLKEALKK